MSNLFEPYVIRDMVIRNRFMRSATTSAYAEEDGTVNDPIIRVYERLSKGEVGLIVKGHLYVTDNGKAHKGMAGISNDKHIPGLRKLTDAVHKHGGRIVAQINHAGVVYQPDRAGPSVYSEGDWTAREMTINEIESTIEAYSDAAERAMQSGFDGVQIHGAHGYLISQFLSSLSNTRTDKWGGSLENRMRFLNEVYDEVRGRIGNDPVLIKINSDDFSQGFTVDDSVKVAKNLRDKGIDLIEVSGGGRGEQKELRPRAKSTDPDLSELAFGGHAAKIREASKPTPMALVYGFSKLETMQKAVDSDLIDMISLSRPYIREPDLVKNLKAGQTEATCIRCDGCRAAFGNAIMTCVLE
ncbi:MAG: NADH:flavin oxidoreductase [Candidatus Bathyarchaeota archaeon]|nr:NADH:flavin oxidoreductase [Candidatus Bathyarchaeota archaeon]